MTIAVRQATEADLPTIARIGSQCFPGADAATRERRIRGHPRAGIEDILVAELGGAIVGTATLIPMRLWWGGAEWPAGGLASVAVAPESRRRGVAKRLCEVAVERLHERDVPLSILFPFDHRYYDALGWHLAGLSRWLRIPASALPRGDHGGVDWLDPAKDGEAIQACHMRWIEGRGVGLVRPPKVWDRLFADRWQWFGLRGAAGLEGYAAVALNQGPNTKQIGLQVEALMGLSPEINRRLLAFLRDQEAQCEWVQLDLPADTPIEQLASNPLRATDGALGNGHSLCSSFVAGAMVRVLDWTGLLTGMQPLGTWHRPSVAIELTGGPRWRLDIEGRWVEVDDGHSDVLLTADARTLTQILWGSLTVAQAQQWGLVRIEGEADLAALSALLSQPPLYIPRADDF